MKIKFKMTWSRYSRLASFTAGAAIVSTPFSFDNFISSGNIWYVWQGAFTLSVFWVMLYLSHIWSKKKGVYQA